MPQLNLSLKLQPKQSELLRLLDGISSWLGYGGSRGGGKSGAARRVMLLRRLKYPGTAGIIFRRVYDDLKKNHIDKFFEEFPQLFPFYRATDHEVILPAVGDKPSSRIVFSYAETETEIRRKFYGPEYMDMFIDQAEQLSENELKTMKTCCRWPGLPDHSCKFVMFFNPGGVGIQFFKRIFRDKEYRDKERAEDFAFIQAYGWDNVEFVRSALIEDGLDEGIFYSWTNEERFNYFITRSQYGKDLNSLPQAMRIGHLMGSLDTFAGQYFDIWDETIHVNKNMEIQWWHPRWISIDWGFAHDSAVYWHAQDTDVTKTYREFVRAGLGPRVLAQKIADLSRLDDVEKEKIDAVYLSPDAFAKRTNEDTIAQQIGTVLRELGLPYPRRADDHRISGWMLMYEMLRRRRWEISSNCPKLIRNLPLFSRDEENIEDCVKFEGDDPGDSARYGLKSRFSSKEPPRELQYAAQMKKIQNELSGKDASQINTALHLGHLRFDSNWARSHRPVRRIRAWRQNAV